VSYHTSLQETFDEEVIDCSKIQEDLNKHMANNMLRTVHNNKDALLSLIKDLVDNHTKTKPWTIPNIETIPKTLFDSNGNIVIIPDIVRAATQLHEFADLLLMYDSCGNEIHSNFSSQIEALKLLGFDLRSHIDNMYCNNCSIENVRFSAQMDSIFTPDDSVRSSSFINSNIGTTRRFKYKLKNGFWSPTYHLTPVLNSNKLISIAVQEKTDLETNRDYEFRIFHPKAGNYIPFPSAQTLEIQYITHLMRGLTAPSKHQHTKCATGTTNSSLLPQDMPLCGVSDWKLENGLYRAFVNNLGNFVVEQSNGNGSFTQVWETGFQPGHDKVMIYQQGDGNLVMYDTSNSNWRAFWACCLGFTNGYPRVNRNNIGNVKNGWFSEWYAPFKMQLRSDGTVAVLNKKNEIVWSSQIQRRE
jgi:hypothetical protein